MTSSFVDLIGLFWLPPPLVYLLPPKKLQTFTGRKYVSMDTLFSLVDAVLYAHLVELKDDGNEFLKGKVRHDSVEG